MKGLLGGLASGALVAVAATVGTLTLVPEVQMGPLNDAPPQAVPSADTSADTTATGMPDASEAVQSPPAPVPAPVPVPFGLPDLSPSDLDAPAARLPDSAPQPTPDASTPRRPATPSTPQRAEESGAEETGAEETGAEETGAGETGAPTLPASPSQPASAPPESAPTQPEPPSTGQLQAPATLDTGRDTSPEDATGSLPQNGSPPLPGRTAPRIGPGSPQGQAIEAQQPNAPVRATTRIAPPPAGSDTISAGAPDPRPSAAVAPGAEGLSAPEAPSSPQAQTDPAALPAAPEQPAPADPDALGQTQPTPATSDLPTTNRLPQIAGTSDAPATADTVAPGPDPEAVTRTTGEADAPGALARNAVPVAPGDDRPLLALVLRDDPAAPIFETPRLSVAIAADTPGAMARAQAWRSVGQEIVLVPSLAEGPPQDVAQALEGALQAIPNAASVMPDGEGGFGGTEDTLPTILSRIAQSGHGLIIWPAGPDGMAQRAAEQGVPTAPVLRRLESAGKDASALSRFLDGAAFDAVRRGAVIVVADNTPEARAALDAWIASARAESVRLVPVSAVLGAQ